MKKDIYRYNIILSIIFIAISICIIKGAGSYGGAVDGTAMGAGSWPCILAVAMIILSLVLLVRTVIEISLEKKDKKSQDGSAAEPSIAWRSDGMKRIYKLLAVLIIFMILLNFLGFYIAAAFLVPAVMYLMGERKIWKMAVLTAGILVFFFAVFYLMLNLKLPVGLLFK